MQLVDLNTLAYLNKSNIWNSFLFSGVKGEEGIDLFAHKS